jgi:hypothetical protein
VCRPSFALGLEQHGDASEAPAPEPKKAYDAVVPNAVLATIGDI